MEQTTLPLRENTLYYEKNEPTRPTQAEVADHRVNLTEERQDLTLFAKETLDQLTSLLNCILQRESLLAMTNWTIQS